MDDLKSLNYAELLTPLKELEMCSFCPRSCNSDRFSGEPGYCRSNAFFNIASICIHKGEEPVISGKNGICNVFFSRCNMQCIYCQNFQISRNKGEIISEKFELKVILEKILAILDTGVEALGFVSPSHFIPHVKIIVEALRKIGRKPITVFNTNGYDKVSSIQYLEDYIDVFLPDFKYMDDSLSVEYSDAPYYSKYASKAILEMYRQKGSSIVTNVNGYAQSGLIIRHLVLPGHIENSLNVLRFIANEISVNVHLSLMSQYYPTDSVANHPFLKRKLTDKEYTAVLDEMYRLGFTKGWVQELESPQHYQPDFLLNHPFEPQ